MVRPKVSCSRTKPTRRSCQKRLIVKSLLILVIQAKIFYERFFRQKDNKDLAEELGIAENVCSAAYQQARERIMRIVEALDGRDYGLKHIQKKGCHFTEYERYFLLNKAFGFSVAEIARMPGAPKMVNLKARLRRMYNQYRKRYLDCPA